MADSLFTKIIKGEIPAHKIYEDDKTYVFLDIRPKMPGHSLVIPKAQIDQFQDLPDEDYLALMQTVKKVARRIKQTLGSDRIGVQIVGVDVPHAHIHVFPFSTMSEYNQPAREASQEELAEMAKKLAF